MLKICVLEPFNKCVNSLFPNKTKVLMISRQKHRRDRNSIQRLSHAVKICHLNFEKADNTNLPDMSHVSYEKIREIM